jgi:hypothetical protein
MKPLVGSVLLSLSTLLLGTAVWADSVPPEAIECFSKKVSDACTVYDTGEPGHCEDGLCTQVWRDGGTSDYACRVCVPGAPCDGACTIGRQSTAKRVGSWLVASLVPLVVFSVRRLRRRP